MGVLILTLTYTARYLDPELQCGPGLVGLATNIESSHPKYDLKQPITIMSRGFQLTKAKEITNKF